MSAGGSLSDLLEASRWRLDVPGTVDEVRAEVEAFLAAESVTVQRMTKKGLRDLDARAPVLSLAVVGDAPPTVTLELVIRHLVPAVRPDDVLAALAAVSGRETRGVPLLTRLEQGPLDLRDTENTQVSGPPASRISGPGTGRVRYSPRSTQVGPTTFSQFGNLCRASPRRGPAVVTGTGQPTAVGTARGSDVTRTAQGVAA